MNEGDHLSDADELLDEYDFSGGVQGKHFREYWRSKGLVHIDEDLLEVFPDAESVNRALRLLLETSRKAAKTG